MDDKRRGKLHWFFKSIIQGNEKIDTPERAKRFIESLRFENDPVSCISSILSSDHGIKALQKSTYIDTTLSFINSSISQLLEYLQTPEIAASCGGELLKKTVFALVELPLFWDILCRHVESRTVNSTVLHGFAWILLQLLSATDQDVSKFIQLACRESIQNALRDAKQSDTRNTYQKIKHVVSTLQKSTNSLVGGPGGRHDNDFEDFRSITILPTVDELISAEPAFMRFAGEIETVDKEQKLAIHLDNQFRLLREDMLRGLKEELKPQQKRRGYKIDGLHLLGVDQGTRNQWALVFECKNGLPFLNKSKVKERKDFLHNHPKVLPNGSLACIFADGTFVGLGLIWRREDHLAEEIPKLHIRLPNSEIAVRHTLKGLHGCSQIQVSQLNTATFAYEPVLQQLQNARQLPLAETILNWLPNEEVPTLDLSPELQSFVDGVKDDPSAQITRGLSLRKPITLDAYQARSLVMGLTHQVAIIQGPPGTGKSFIGALIAKALHDHTDSKILVLSYTNHALDQYLEDLIRIGIPTDDMVRLGSFFKASSTTKSLVLQEQMKTNQQYKLTRAHWELKDSYEDLANKAASNLAKSFGEYSQNSPAKKDMMEYLEFSPDHDVFFDAFQLPDQGDFQVVGERGKKITQFYLLDRWCRNQNAGVFKEYSVRYTKVWGMPQDERQGLLRRWLDDILNERLCRVAEYGSDYNRRLTDVKTIFAEQGQRLMRDKRIIGCTTTAAAKSVKDIQSVQPDVIIVEEAGEILESHILSALSASTKQIVLIGDHKQLRPKVHYALSVEKGDGYDLNRSLFERLVLKNYPHVTLSQQHRMRPEISALVRQLTYPELTDADDTKNRSSISGLQDNIIFVNHNITENEGDYLYDPREGGMSSSKTNDFEAYMTLKCVKYLAQQGYNSGQLVVLTPYLGQLLLLYEVLQDENDPVLNDMDTYDLIRAGLLPQAAAKVGRNKLRISTIDNYQGEESDIVVASLTRSNNQFDIGFLASPERLNVLISRARDGIILIGNAEMFMNARKGKDLWTQFLTMLKNGSHIYGGLPIRCQRHPDREAIVSNPADFDKICPDGGCNAPCDKILNCGVHSCPQQCHQVYDHSKMKCNVIVTDKCSNGHKLSWSCYERRPLVCEKCEKMKRRQENKIREEHEKQLKDAADRKAHEDRMADLDSQIAQIQLDMSNINLAKERQSAYQQKLIDLENAKKSSKIIREKESSRPSQPNSMNNSITSNDHPATRPGPTVTNDSTTSTNDVRTPVNSPPLQSSASVEWDRMKEVDNVSNDIIDELMRMTGLESVKCQFLDVLQKLQTAQRQGTDLKNERLGTVLLGNPGTGKTTVARLYAKFLASVGAIPGGEFVETTGAKLANEGVSGAKKVLEGVIKAGGGAIFIDEAYQLVSGSNYGGSAVLDFLLAEIENTTGEVLFMFAGYDNQMEKFFQHNPGLPSRMPIQLKFADYSEAELLHMLGHKIKKKYNGRMKIEDGSGGLFMRIVIRRLHRLSGKEGFGNARALENVLARITSAQSRRLNSERREGKQPDDFFFSKEDMIGPEPSGVLQQSMAWATLQKMPGLNSVKASVKTLLERLTTNYRRELKEQKPIEVSLNKLFLGSPGTGKTTVAKLYGQILAEIGMLSTSEYIVKTPADFIGSFMGESEKNTKSILENTKGKVLVIDEAYMLSSTTPDPYRTAVIDTLVSEVHSVPGDDRAVLLLGYQEQMEDMLRKVNPGLARRFPIESAFVFEDYDDDQLLSILNYKLQDQALSATPAAKKTAIDVLGKLRRRPNFGNAGEVENLLTRAKENFSKRQQSLPFHQRDDDGPFESEDIDPDCDRSNNAFENCKLMFKDVVGSENVLSKLLGYIQIFNNALEMELDPEESIPFNFVFKGPPGTGKTTTARKIGKVFCDMGFLASDNVVECSATDLVGQFVGQTGPKVVEKFNEALGQVLFIDEAYRLGEGPYAKEAIDEIVDCLTKQRYKGKMIVILAGYEDEINRLLSINPGLSSRFPEEIMFSNLSPSLCVQLLVKRLQKNEKSETELSSAGGHLEVAEDLFMHLSQLSGWGNGRDIETLASRIIGTVLRTKKVQDGKMKITWNDVLPPLEQFHQERTKRAAVEPKWATGNSAHQLQMQTQQSQPPPMNTTSSSAWHQQEQSHQPETAKLEGDKMSLSQVRDANVSNEVWEQLQIDRIHREQAEAKLEADINRSRQEQKKLKENAIHLKAKAESLEKQAAKDDEERRLQEQMRIKAVEAIREADEEAARLKKLQEEKQKEQQAQQKLKEMGICPVGFRWIKQASGYRCAGGGHWVDNTSLGM